MQNGSPQRPEPTPVNQLFYRSVNYTFMLKSSGYNLGEKQTLQFKHTQNRL